MLYKLRNTLIPVPESHRQPLLATLAMYDRGEDLANSPLIKSRVNLTHMDVYFAEDKETALQERQKALIALYERIKGSGYNGSPILAWFDDEGFIHLYDGYHRLAIMEHLGLTTEVNVEVNWQGIDHSVGRDFPLADVLAKEPPGGRMTYQPVGDPRLKGWAVDRPDSPQRLDYILKNLAGKTILDIGCSEGYFSRELAKRGYKVTAIDDRPGLVAAARYLTTLSNLEVGYEVADWRGYLKRDGHFDNILFLSVLHNNMKADGVDECLKALELFRGKANRVFFEVPNNTNERQWMRENWPNFDFHKELPRLEQLMGMKVQGKYDGLRSIYLFGNGKASLPWWSLQSWILPERTHYRPLFETLKSRPCRNIMEIGTHAGNTAVVMIKAAAQKVPEEEIHYYGFDLFEEMTPQVSKQEFSFAKMPPSMESAKAHIEKHTRAKVTLIKGNTRKTLGEAVKTLPKMDLIYIDGGHTIETTRNDWRYASRLMHKGTIVYFDDYCDEMPFIGARFIVDELEPKYVSEVMPETNYYPRAFGRLKSQLLKVELRSALVKKTKKPVTHFRFHLLGLAHSKTTKDWVLCPFTQLTYKMGQMMTELGHEVYHYGAEGSNLPCTEHIDVLSDAVQKQTYGDWNPYEQLWIHSGNDLAYTTFRKNAIREINLRKQPHDILLVSIGNWEQEIADAVGMLTVEFCVGYLGFFSKHKVFPSYAWMHHMYGKLSASWKENFVLGQWYDAVIPHYFNPDDFEFSDKKDDYYLFIGRLITRKGPHVAIDLCKRIGAKLVVAGQPLYSDSPRKEESLRELGINQPHVEYVGVVNREQRNKLMSRARAVLVPSLYIEPFGQVVVESLLCGTPVITTDWGSFAEVVSHGEVGYRCRTMDDFIWSAKNIDKIDPHRCREYAAANYSMARISKMYEEYFTKIYDLFSGGWYEERPNRVELDWLRRY